MLKNSVISLISYDAEYLPKSIEKYYEYVDEIVLGLDKNRVTWAGNSFSFDETKLWKDLSVIDGDSKISVIEDNFHKSDVAIKNDNYERNFLKEECQHDIIISVDADEYLLNAKAFFEDYLPIVTPYLKDNDICFTWVTPYKEIGDTTLVIANEDNSALIEETQGFVTHKNATFTYARWTDRSQGIANRLLSPLMVLHYSLCRNQESLHEKINNTGHSDLIGHDPFYDIWSQVTMENFQELRNFKTSGLGGAQWPKLVPVKTENLEKYYEQFIERIY